jgi:hypothetical protein
MKAKFHKLISTAVLGLALYSNSPSAWAGTVLRKEVQISVDGNFVAGSLTGARYSADGQQYIGCQTTSYPAQPTNVDCRAQDKTGRYFYCNVADGRLAAALMGMTDSSHLIVVKDAFNQCTEIVVTNDSVNLR